MKSFEKIQPSSYRPLWLPQGKDPRIATAAGMLKGGAFANHNMVGIRVHVSVATTWLKRMKLKPLMQTSAGVQWWDLYQILSELAQDRRGQESFGTDATILTEFLDHLVPWPSDWGIVTLPISRTLSSELGMPHLKATQWVMSATLRGELPSYGLATSPAHAAWCKEQIIERRKQGV